MESGAAPTILSPIPSWSLPRLRRLTTNSPNKIAFILPSSKDVVVGMNKYHRHHHHHLAKGSARSSGPPPGVFELTPDNVDLALDDVRPYLMADGGNVSVVSVQDGTVSLKLQGACGTCPSSTTTMKMGIERVLKEKFGDALKDICQVYDDQVQEITVEAINGHLDILRPAIKNFGGSVQVLSVEGGECIVNYVGPESIGSGIKAAIKEKFPDIVNVVFSG